MISLLILNNNHYFACDYLKYYATGNSIVQASKMNCETACTCEGDFETGTDGAEQS